MPPGLNRALVRAWAEPRHDFPRTRAWPLPGGLDAWRTEARADAAALGVEPLTDVE
ncbi:MAG: hypothetical protein R3F60_16025 [bacterium]